MVNVTPISKLFLALAIAAFVLTAVPTAHSADVADSTEKNDAAADLRRHEIELRNALKANPNDADTHFQLGRIYLDEGNWRAAITELRAARRNNTPNDDLDAQLAWALYLQNDFDALFREIRPGERSSKAESKVRMSLGLGYLYTSEFSSAERLLRDAVRLDPGSWQAHIALARMLILLRKLPEAREQLDAASGQAPNQIGVTRIQGQLLRAGGNAAGAIAAYTKVLEVQPSSVPAMLGRADALISENKLSEAQADLSQARKASKHSQISFLTALILARQDKFADADQVLTAASSSFDGMPIAYYLGGVVKFKRGFFETAERYLAKFQAKQPDNSGAARLRAEIAFRRNDPTAAAQLLEPVVKANPADQAAVSDLARAYLASGRSDQVIRLFEEVAAAPANVAAQPNPVGLLMVYGDAVGDLVEIEKVLMTKAPDAAVVMSDLRRGNLTNAAAIAESLAGNGANDPVIQNLLGSVRLAQKRLPDAEVIFRRIREQNRDFMPAAMNLVEVLVAQKKDDEAKVMLRDLTQQRQ